jgi:hypothetical protein
MKGHSIVEPVSTSRTNNQEFLEETRDAASNFVCAVLRHVDGCNTGHSTNTKTSNKSASVNLANVVKRCDLDDSTDQEDNCES